MTRPHTPSRVERVRGWAVDWFWMIVLSFLSLYGFLTLLGGIHPAEAAGASIAAAGGAVLFAGHVWRQRRHREETQGDPRLRAAHERRGY